MNLKLKVSNWKKIINDIEIYKMKKVTKNKIINWLKTIKMYINPKKIKWESNLEN